MPPKKKKELTFLQKALVTSVLIFLIIVVPKRQDNRAIGDQNHRPPARPQETSHAQKMLDDSPIIEPVKTMTKIGVGIIEQMGNENIRHNKAVLDEVHAAAKAKRPVDWESLNYRNDIPPEEHPQKWSRMQIGNQYCWLHVKTLKKVCQ